MIFVRLIEDILFWSYMRSEFFLSVSDRISDKNPFVNYTYTYIPKKIAWWSVMDDNEVNESLMCTMFKTLKWKVPCFPWHMQVKKKAHSLISIISSRLIHVKGPSDTFDSRRESHLADYSIHTRSSNEFTAEKLTVNSFWIPRQLLNISTLINVEFH